MIIAALDTGMRRGEMLALRFADVDLPRGLVTLRGETTKSRKTRVVPIATTRLRAVLEWLRLDAAGQEKPDEAPVFSYETGEAVGSIKTAWVVAVLKAHDVQPHWRREGAWRDLSAASRAEFRALDLHWHDLRHEYASRLVERGVPLAQVRDLLGHASITTTERYDNQTLQNLKAAATRLESGATFDASARPSLCQVLVKNDRNGALSGGANDKPENVSKELKEKGLEGWYRYGDSNPGPVAENHVS